MTLFWIITAAMIVVALAFIVPSLWRKSVLRVSDRDKQNVVIARERLAELNNELAAGTLSDEEYEQTKLELEQTLLIDLEAGDEAAQAGGPGKAGMLTLLFSVLFVAVVTVSAYLYLGTPQLVDPAAMQAQQADQELPSIEEMMTALVDRLKENPEDAEGWYLLGRTYMAVKDYQKAAFAFDKLNQLVSDQPSIMLALADSLAMAAGGDMQGRPAELIRRAVDLAPQDQTALWLAGMVEDQAGNHARALEYWGRLKPMLADDLESTQQVDRLMAAAQRKLTAAGPGEAEQKTAAALPTGQAITAHITLAAELAARVQPEESLFVYARALQGPKMPLAAVRLKVSDLPATIQLNDGQAMVPGMNLSSFDQVVVGARISRSGNAIAASGDLLGEVSPVAVQGDVVVELVIDSVIP
ncbi:c-type cytochrome biogenesis protein CcmI [Sedimenticola hydrogenitrophicus]|uniref:c-type cytochrome biogenesis protein CcmI n=1 Tax=Sedimenticola hydrogenitrophicus TaxID=2967975 RepID=UPI0021A5FF43|nr:c-type cytochrome biogenesis protein CcmI [Sedimenticola hydrogenitrophicus]